jgi:Ca2+-binding RTX toxin-like protein
MQLVVIVGLAGNHTLVALCGGPGNDTLLGNAGADQLFR